MDGVHDVGHLSVLAALPARARPRSTTCATASRWSSTPTTARRRSTCSTPRIRSSRPIAAIFPTLFKDASAMPADLRKHVRYPELLLEAAGRGLRPVPHDRSRTCSTTARICGPSRAEVGMNDAARAGDAADGAELRADEAAGRDATIEFVEILPFTPANRNNLIGWIAGRSDGDALRQGGRLQLPEDTGSSTARCRSKRASIRTRSSPASCRCGTSRARTSGAAA